MMSPIPERQPKYEGWLLVEQEPPVTGNYIVAVWPYEPIVAFFIKDKGWDLGNTIHAALEHRIVAWMPLPEIRYDRRYQPQRP
jgi:hypothetical protein